MQNVLNRTFLNARNSKGVPDFVIGSIIFAVAFTQYQILPHFFSPYYLPDLATGMFALWVLFKPTGVSILCGVALGLLIEWLSFAPAGSVALSYTICVLIGHGLRSYIDWHYLFSLVFYVLIFVLLATLCVYTLGKILSLEAGSLENFILPLMINAIIWPILLSSTLLRNVLLVNQVE